MVRSRLTARFQQCALVLALACGAAWPAAIAPTAIDPTSLAGDLPHGIFSDRTRVVALAIDRDGARLLAHTIKARPHTRILSVAPPRPFGGSGRLQVEVVLLSQAGQRHTQRLDVGPICLLHGPEHQPHVEGDTVTSHQETFLVEMPDIEGFDRIEVAVRRDGGALSRETLATEKLDAERFLADPPSRARVPTGTTAGTAAGPVAQPLAGQQVTWPEALGDPDRVTTYGNPGEGDRRINITIIPDGYTYDQKGLMRSHADALVAFLRAKTPFKEHDPFINYNLVYAYSNESGTDECDCGVVRNTAMGTGFIYVYGPCGDHANRCLYFGSGCDTPWINNMTMAEMRVPYHDVSIVMVNTSRYGGCGGTRAVFAAANPSAMEAAAHELGHTLAQLADEYQGRPACGSSAGEINTSDNPATGAWPEWVGDLGPPVEGAQYYNACIYRPAASCLMRSLDAQFCPVCNQRWTISTFGHPRIAGRAPVISVKPPTQANTACLGFPHAYRVGTRFSTEGTVTNSIIWTLDPPGGSDPVQVGSGETTHLQTFTELGDQELQCEVVADTNFVKPEKYFFNRFVITWHVDVVDGTGDTDGDGCAPSGDCDEGAGAVYPGAPQICDGLNNDCNEASWPSVAGSNETDDDADAFSECAGDCNDAKASVHPGAPEINDGIDNQCPGDEGAGAIDEAGTDVAFTGPHPSPFCWTPQPGAAQYTVARARGPMMIALCEVEGAAENCVNDVDIPPKPGWIFYYLVRAELPFTGSWGKSTAGEERIVPCSGKCGNGYQEGSEACDGADLNGKTCSDFGFPEGTLICKSGCNGFNTSGCYVP